MNYNERKEKLLANILDVYGSYNAYCRITGINQYQFQLFRQKVNVDAKTLRMMESKFKMAPNAIDPKLVSEDIIQQLKNKISGYGIAKFCRDYNQKISNVKRIIYGNGSRLSSGTQELLYLTGIWKRK